MRDVLLALWDVVLFFIPHFVTEDVAVIRRRDGELDPVCSLDAIEDDDIFDGIASVTCLAWFGYGFSLSPSKDSFRPWRGKWCGQ